MENKEIINQKIVRLLEIGEENNGQIVFNEEAKTLIHEVSEFAKGTKLFQDNQDKGAEYIKTMTAAEIYEDMIYKIAKAPTYIHAVSSAYLLIPYIDMKLKGE